MDISINSDIWEGQIIDIPATSHNKHIILINIYKPPKDNNNNKNIDTFISEISAVLHTLSNSKANIIITGDFNIDLLKINNRLVFNEFFNILITNGFHPSITLPTRFTENSCSLIDNIFHRNIPRSNLLSAGILLSDISDHLPCFACFDLTTVHTVPCIKLYQHKWSDKLTQQLYDELFSTQIYEKLETNPNVDPNINYSILENILTTAVNKIMPNKHAKLNKYKHKKSPWITVGIIKSIKFKDKLYKSVKLLNPTSNEYLTAKNNLRVYKSILNKCIRVAKKSYYSSQLNLHKKDSSKTWQILNNIMNKNINNSSASNFDINGSIISDKSHIANEFNKYFTEIGPKLAPNPAPGIQHDYKFFLSQDIQSKFTFTNIQEAEVKKTILDLHSKNSSGFDFITTKLLKKLEPLLTKSLTLIINQSLNTGIFPNSLKLAKVIPIFKKHDKSKIENYRPISILPSISKVFESIVHKQLLDYMNQYQLFSPHQYGFRKFHSTEHAILEVIDRIIYYMDEGYTPITLFIDLSKAFDTLNHDILITKLNYYGIQNNSLNWFISYLGDRKQYVEYENISSNITQINTGVPQGSILGPLLFNIYMTDISKATDFFHIVQYADDTSLINSMSDYTISHNSCKLNCELQKIYDWLTLNRLSLNISKTKYLMFSPKQKHVAYPTVRLNEQTVEKVSEFDFLGIILNQHMTWESHVKKVGHKINRNIGLINKMKHFLPTYALKILYDSLILPHFNYGILAWGTSTKQLFKLQKKAIRVITKSKYNAHSDPIFKSIQTLKLDDIYKINILKFYYKYLHRNLPTFFYSFSLKTRFEIHNYNTRNRKNIVKNKTRHRFADNCVRNKLPDIINCTSPNIINKIHTHSFEGYIAYIKKIFISEYEENCSVENCYVCRNN